MGAVLLGLLHSSFTPGTADKSNIGIQVRQSSLFWKEARLLFPVVPAPSLNEILLDDTAPCEPISSDLHMGSLERLKELREIALNSKRMSNEKRPVFVAEIDDIRREKVALGLIQTLGPRVLRFPCLLDILNRKRAEAQTGTLKERQSATNWLRNFARLFLPDNRGKYQSSTPTSLGAVRFYYYTELFRLYDIENALRTFPGSPKNKVIAASESFELPAETIRELWYLDEAFKPSPPQL